ELFETNELKAQIQEKDTVILKLKDKTKSSSGDVKERKVEKEVEEIETLNIELDYKVTKLTAENNHLKQTYKQLFDSIKSSRVQSKEQCDDLINKVNLKSVEVANLNASLQEKVLVITALKEQLKGKAVLTKAISLNPIDPALLQVDVVPLVPKLCKVFKTVGYIWKPTGRTFTLVGNVYPLTGIATATIVPPREPIPIVKSTDKPVVTLVYTRKPKAKNVPNKMEPNKSWGSSSNVSTPITDCRLSKSSSDLEVAFRQHTGFICNLEGVDLLTGSRGNNLYTLSLQDMMASSPICLLSKASKTKSWLWHRRLSHLNFGAINHLARQGLVRVRRIRTDNGTEFVNQTLRDYYEEVGISHETSVARSPQQNGAEAVANACFTQNRSIVRLRHGKTPYEVMHGKQPDLSFFHVFGALCYPTNDSENIGKLQPKADIGIFIGYAPTKKAFRIYNRLTRRIVETIHVDFDELTDMASEQSSSGPTLNDIIPGTISSGLVQKPSSFTSYVPPSRNDWDLLFQPNDWDLLFQPLFDELLNPPPSVDNQDAKVTAPIAEVIPQVNDDSIGSPSSTAVDQDAPSPSKSLTPTEIQSPIILQDVGNDNLDIEVAHMGNDPLLGAPITEVASGQSSSTTSPQLNVQPNHPLTHPNSKWTKDHPLNYIIGPLSRPVSTRLQLHEQALFCYYDAFLTLVEPKTYKEALTQACWIEAM
nr:hypothetical protein [Tanacetum cinerariifolium]